jgi:hypothetical protein
MGLPESTLNVRMGTKLFLTLEMAAVHQIDAAIDAPEAGLFDVALTFAGAAEGMIERSGLHMFGELKNSPAALARFTQKEWISILNMERDWLKHGGQPAMEIHCSTAAFMIARATTKIENWSPRMVEFKIWMLANLDRI